MELDAFLDDLQEQGTPMEPGDFTISEEEALRKMREYQLLSPGSFASHLVAAVVAAGGTYLAFHTTKEGLTFSFDKPHLDQVHFDEFFHALFASGSLLWHRELAIAVNAALGLKPRVLTLQSWDTADQNGHLLKLEGKDQRLVSLRPTQRRRRQGSRVDLFLRPPGARGFNLKRFSAPVARELRSRCCYAPIQVTVNSKGTRKALLGKNEPLVHQYWAGESVLPLDLEGCDNGAQPPERHQHDEEFSAYLAIEARKGADVVLVVDGVSFSLQDQVKIEVPLLRAVVSATGLRKDISQANLLQEERLDSIVTWLNRKSKEMLLSRCATLVPMVERANELFCACLKTVFSTDVPIEVHSWLDQVKTLRMASDPEYYEQVLSTISGLRKGRTQALWEKLRWSHLLWLETLYRERDWTQALVAVKRLREIPLESPPEQSEAFLVLSVLAGEAVPTLIDTDLELPWFKERRAVLSILAGRYDVDFGALDEGWGHYLQAQMALPDLPRARALFRSALECGPQWRYLHNDLAEIAYLVGNFRDGLKHRTEFRRLEPPGRRFWAHFLGTEAMAHGTMSQWARWSVANSVYSLVLGDNSGAPSLNRAFKNYNKYRWQTELKESEGHSLGSGAWTYRFKRAVWGFRAEEHWREPREYQLRRLLRASLGATPTELVEPDPRVL